MGIALAAAPAPPTLEAFLEAASEREPKLTFHLFRHAKTGALVADISDAASGEAVCFAVVGNRALPVDRALAMAGAPEGGEIRGV
jgi:thiamine pyrophosphate-dependent acetolactate synthase large subunit-like protein